MKEIELPFDFNVFDSDLEEYRISIPKGFKAEINENSVILKKECSKDEEIRKQLIAIYSIGAQVNAKTGNILDKDIVAWLEKQAEPKPTAWSKEDNYNLESCVLAILHSDLYVSDDKQKLENWLNSIKNRLV